MKEKANILQIVNGGEIYRSPQSLFFLVVIVGDGEEIKPYRNLIL